MLKIKVIQIAHTRSSEELEKRLTEELAALGNVHIKNITQGPWSTSKLEDAEYTTSQYTVFFEKIEQPSNPKKLNLNVEVDTLKEHPARRKEKHIDGMAVGMLGAFGFVD